uniref:(northern house mosquito) hypothetical protein n=1 Tax=Culex pipiens TaxID=7175 RepID=A0A8D8GNI3_CULPI
MRSGKHADVQVEQTGVSLIPGNDHRHLVAALDHGRPDNTRRPIQIQHARNFIPSDVILHVARNIAANVKGLPVPHQYLQPLKLVRREGHFVLNQQDHVVTIGPGWDYKERFHRFEGLRWDVLRSEVTVDVAQNLGRLPADRDVQVASNLECPDRVDLFRGKVGDQIEFPTVFLPSFQRIDASGVILGDRNQVFITVVDNTDRTTGKVQIEHLHKPKLLPLEVELVQRRRD